MSLSLLIGSLAWGAQAGEHRFQILLDTDNNTTTGCPVPTVKGTAFGIEQAWTTVVTTTATGASVTRIERQTCVGSSLSEPTLFATAGWPAGLGNGGSSTAAIETYLPLSALPPLGTMSGRVASTNATGGQDATAAFLIAAAPPAATPVPLSPWLVLPMAMLVLALGWWWHRRHPGQMSLFVCVVLVAASGLVWAGTVILDGNIDDWNGIVAVAGNPKGSAPVNANIIGVFYQSDSANLYFRVDADVRPDAPGNQAPVVSAGTNQTITLPSVANLAGTASDDGLPNPPGALTLAWTKLNGPGVVTFGNPALAVTTATFTAAGQYMLQLSAFDGALTSTSTVVITVNSAGNQAPVVSAGTNQTITLPSVANLAGTASDDGLPNPPGALTLAWTKLNGPGVVTFGNPALAVTTATFAAAGQYTLQLSAFDGALTTTSTVVITVNATGPQFLPIGDSTIPLGSRFQQVLAANESNSTLTYSLIASPTGAALNPPPLVDWTPTAAQLGLNTFTARVTDSLGNAATITFHVTVVYVDHAPQLAPQADVSLGVGTAFSRTLTATDPDAGDTLTFALVSGPAGMTLNGAILNWSTTGLAPIAYPVTVKVTDGSGLSDTKLFVITLIATSPPAANDDSYQVILGHTLTVPTPGVLGNDADPSGHALTAAKLSDPTKGVLSAFNADGSFIYQAPAVLPGPVFAPVVKYHIDEPGPTFFEHSHAPLVADVDGDGKPEIIVHIGFGFRALRGTDGSQLWSTPLFPPPYDDCRTGGGNVFHAAIGDIDDSGQLSIVFPVSCGRDNLPTMIIGTNLARYAALNARDGSFKWLSPPLSRELDSAGNPDSLAFGTVPTLARVHANETPSIVIGANVSYFLFNGKPECDQLIPGWPANVACRGIFVLDGKDGSVRQRMAAPQAATYDITTYSNGTQAAVVADLDNDGSVEFVFGGAVFNNDGSVRWNNTDTAAGHPVSFWNGVANFDDTPDIEVARLEGNGSGGGGPIRLAVYKSNGSLLWALPLSGTPSVGIPVIADVDGTGRPAIVLNVGSNVCAVDYRGTYKWCYDAGTVDGVTPKIPIGIRSQVYDLDGDGVPEVIVPVNPETLLFLDGKTGALKFKLDMALANDGPAPSSRFGDFLGGPAIADLDGSGHASIVSLWDNFGRLDVVSSQNNDWRPARKIFNQASYQYGNVNDDGTIPRVFVNNFATPATNVFGTQAQVLTPVDPRLKTQTTFTYKANNSMQSSSPATVTIEILPVNRPPVFTSIPPTRYVSPDFNFTYVAHAVDPDPGDTVTYSLALAQPNGSQSCTMAPATGVLSCTLLSGDLNFIIVATDSFGAQVYQNIHLQPSAGPGVIPNVVGLTQAAADTALIGAGFATGNITLVFNAAPVGQVVAQAPSAGASALLGSLVDVSVSQGPAPVAVPFVVGKQLQAANVQLVGLGLTVIVNLAPSTVIPVGEVMAQSPAFGTLLSPTPANPVTLTVSSGAAPPLANLNHIVVKPAVAARVVGEKAQFTATGIYNNGTSADFTLFVTWASTVPAVATIDLTGIAHAVGPGSTSLIATVGSFTAQGTLNVSVFVPGDGVPPTALITAPASGSSVSAPTQVVGTATDANFLRYELAVAPADATAYTLIGEGTAPVTSGVLGTFDPTLLINGLYTIRLTVFDSGDNESVATTTVQVRGARKVGVFTLTFQDLNVPASGLPLTITRTYDSRDKTQGDFGIGWRLGQQTLRLRTNRVLGTGWIRTVSGPVVSLVPTSEHKVTVTTPDGRIEEFDMSVSPTSNIGSLDATTITGYIPRPGTLGKLEALVNNNMLILSSGAEVELVDDSSFATYNPQLYRYTMVDGTQFEISPTAGVKKITDRNGNVVTFGPGGILHSNGTGIVFTRDANGRIVAITDPTGAVRTYAYDGNGDLVSFTSAVGDVTRFSYDLNHNVVDWKAPDGNSPMRNDYDESGRLIATTDARGHKVTFTHDVGASREIVLNRLGNQLVIDYDVAGRVLAETDALGGYRAFTYDSNDNKLTETDPLGRVSTMTYDAQNNMLTRTDFEGNTSVYTYNTFRQILTARDPQGRITTNVYDPNGNLIQVTDPEGGIVSNTYDTAGNLLTSHDQLGNVTGAVYDGSGNKLSQTDPLGRVTTYAYDANNRAISNTDPAGRQAKAVFDASGRVTTSIDRLGNTTSITYSPVADGSKPATRTDAVGRLTTFEYDGVGNLTRTVHPDGTTELITYDAEDHPLTKTNPDADVTAFEYDQLSRLTRQTNPDGTFQSRTYDSTGRILTVTNERGAVTTNVYTPNAQTVTDALGNVTVHKFDAKSHLTNRVDALGRVTTYDFDSADNLVKVTSPDGTFTTTTFDAAKRKIAVTDQAGKTTQFTYDSSGQLTRVTDAAGGVTTYAYDAAGNRIAQTDANGHATQMSYDAIGHILSRTRPSGRHEAFAYDASGNAVAHTDFSGRTSTRAYDAMNRMVRENLPDGTTVTYAYAPSGLRAQAGGDNSTYDHRGRLVTEVKASGESITYAYDAAGNKTSLTTAEGTTAYTYDALNRLATVVAGGATTAYTYDALGNQHTTALPNGITTTFVYDSLNRLIQLTNTGPGGVVSSYAYTLGPAGNRLQMAETGAATDQRTVTYVYDSLYRLNQEGIAQPGQANQTFSYSYDAVGNRTQMNRTGTLTDYSYDTDDRLITEVSAGTATTSTYDENGNLITRSGGGTTESYGYDAKNQLLTAFTPTGTTTFTYDADGLRTSSTTGGVLTTFLVDKNRKLAQVLVEKTAATTVVYTYGNQLISQLRPGAAASFYVVDGQLSTRQLTNSSGAVTDRYTFDAFGRTLSSAGSTPNVYLYTGEQLDPNVGFYYLRARYYDGQRGRFFSTDPEDGNIFDPMSLHRYLYANANPVTFADPSGRQLAEILSVVALVLTVDAAVGAVVAGVTNLALKGFPRTGKRAAFFADVVGGGLGGGFSALPGVGPFIAGAISGAKGLFITHYIARQDITYGDVEAAFFIDFLVGGEVGLLVQLSTLDFGQSFIAGAGAQNVLRLFGAFVAFLTGTNTQELEKFLKKGDPIAGQSNFWCKNDYFPALLTFALSCK